MSTTNSGTGIVIGSEIIIAGVIFFFMLIAFAFFLYFYTIGRNHLRRSSHSGDTIPATTLELRTSTGLEDDVIQSIPVVSFSSSDGVECAVCLSEIGDGEKARLLPRCKHGFHLVCIDLWLRSHSTCPLCRCAVTGEVAGGDNERSQRVEIQIEVPAVDERPSMEEVMNNNNNNNNNNKSPVISSSPRLRSLTRLWSQGKRTMGVGSSSSSSLSPREGDVEDQGMHSGL